MAQGNGKTKRAIVTACAVLGVLLLIIGAIALVRSMAGDSKVENTKKSQQDASSTERASSTDTDDESKSNNEDSDKSTSSPSANEPELDPSTVSTITITPMGITVSYVKDINGFEYVVNRSPRGGQYVEFRNEELKGTKCTNDEGTFASIIERPEANESAALIKKTTVDGVEYGLSLAAMNCTSNPDLLKTYQDSFVRAFSLLKKAE